MRWNRSAAPIAIGALIWLAAPAWGHERVQQPLAPNAGSSAIGQARLVMQDDSDGRLILVVHGLAPDQTYDVIVGSVKVGTLTTTGGGNGSVRFRTQPHGHDLMLGFDPHGALITIRSADGTDVLVGTLPVASNNPSDKIACCVPDDNAEKCEDRTADECTAQGGTPVAATSCMPNPCAGAPPAHGDSICCVPDDGGTECEDRTAAECAARGGTVVTATTCTPNPCEATPPADPKIVCCVPDDRGPECEDRTAAQCAAQGGVNLGAGSCSPDPCASAAPPATVGADDNGGSRGSNSGGGHGGSGGHSGDDGGGDNGGGATVYYGASS